jgi:flagellar motility protein MotE (MotC chaperone)
MKRQIIIVVTVFSIIIILALLAAYGIYRFYPEWIGLSSSNETTDQILQNPADTTVLIPKVVIPQSKLDEIQFAKLNNELLQGYIDRQNNWNNLLIDSINKIHQKYFAMKDSVDKTIGRVSDSQNNLGKMNDSLNSLNGQVLKLQNDNKLMQTRLQAYDKFMEKRFDSLQTVNFKNYASIYNNSSPSEVAKILEQIDEQDASSILKFMQKKKAGKVLDAMLPERAAAILLLGANK